MKVRTNTPLFLGKVEAYYKELLDGSRPCRQLAAARLS